MKYSASVLLLLVALMQCMQAIIVHAVDTQPSSFLVGSGSANNNETETISAEELEFQQAFDKTIRSQRMKAGKKLEYAIARWQATKYLPVTGIMEESHWKYLVPTLQNEYEYKNRGVRENKNTYLEKGYTVLALNELLKNSQQLTARKNGADPFVMDDAMLKDVSMYNHRCGVTALTVYGDESLKMRTWSTLFGKDKCDMMDVKYDFEATWPVISRNSGSSVYVLALKYILMDLGFMYEGGDAFIETDTEEDKNCPLTFNTVTGIELLKAIKRRVHHPETFNYINEKNGEPILDKKLWKLLYTNADLEPTGKVEGYHSKALVSLLTGHGYHKMGWSFSNDGRYSKGFIKAMIAFQEKWQSMGVTNSEGRVTAKDWEVLIHPYYINQINYGDKSETVRAACFLAKYQSGEYSEEVIKKIIAEEK